MTAWLLERAWLGPEEGTRDDVLVEVEDGVLTRVEPDARDAARDTAGATRLAGLTLPGFANAHSHAFHRALRGRTQRERGTFWTWREQMYTLAARLDPDSYLDLATAVYAEMAACGWTTVGEFHYLHHQPDGTPYDDPNAMGHALVEAASRAGVRLVLLDTCYLASGFGAPVEGVQRRFSDGDVEAWQERASAVRGNDRARVGGAFHSVRAVPQDQMRRVTSHAFTPFHVHLSEQRAENEACRAATGLTPTQLLAETGHLGEHVTVVHATHLTDDDVALLGRTRTNVSFCPTTERDLADGVGPSRALHEAGARLSLGSDSHAVVDPFEEMRAVELDHRLATEQRGHWSAAELLRAGTRHDVDSLGFDDRTGRIRVGAPADLVTVATDTPTTAGTGSDEQTAVFAATAADVTQVVVAGRVVHDGDRAGVGRRLAEAIERVWA